MPDLKALNLNGNILDIDLILCMVKLNFVVLKILHIGENSIRDIEEINAMKDLELQELVLTGNPICKSINSQMTISNMCKNGVLNSCDWMVWIFENLSCAI